MELVQTCCYDLQRSHQAISENNIDEAKQLCLRATKTISKLLNSVDPNILKTVRPVAQYTVDYYSRLLEKGLSLLTFQEKILWLSSTVLGSTWFPVLDLRGFSSFNIAPYQLQEPVLQMPELGIPIKLQNVVCDDSLEGIQDLYQDLLPNCSFVLSLLSIADEGMGDQLLSLVQKFPEHIKVKLHFNGCEREIALSTLLPFVETQGRSLCVRSFSNPSLYWPALLEKAFLIAMGDHYTFGGSNMAQDTYMLLGWLPEVRIMSESSMRSIGQLWKLRQSGHVTLGFGTGKMLAKLASQLNVVPEHDYVVCGYNEESLMVTLKNPWVRPEDVSDLEKEQARLLHVDLSIMGQFRYLYVNWKPIYKQKSSVLFISKACLLAERPQFTLQSQEDQEVAVVVEQHIGKNSPFTVQVYANTDGKVLSSLQYLLEAAETTNSRVHYFTAKVVPHKCTVVVTSDTLATYTLTILHNKELDLRKAVHKYPNTLTVQDHWGLGTSGGNWGLETYINNPQFDLSIGPDVLNIMMLLTSNNNADINFHVLHCEADSINKKLRNFDKSKLLFNDNYTRNLHLQEFKVEPGIYRVVVSCFEAQEGNFELSVMHDGPNNVQLTQVPQALGLYNQKLQFDWDLSNRHKIHFFADYRGAKVTFQFTSGVSNLRYRPAIRASVFEALLGEPVVITNQWNDCVYGVFLDCNVPEANKDYILLVERFETGDGSCRVAVGSSCKLTIT